MGSWISGSQHMILSEAMQGVEHTLLNVCIDSSLDESQPFPIWKGYNVINVPSSNRLFLQGMLLYQELRIYLYC